MKTFGVWGWVLAMACSTQESWLTMEIDSGVPYSEVVVDGTELTCLIDTGLAGEVLARSDLGIDGDVRAEFGSQRFEVRVASDPSFDPVLDSLSNDSRTVDCLVGWHALRNHAVTFDYAASRWRVARSRKASYEIADASLASPIHVPFESTNRWAMVLLDVEATVIPAAVDTGASLVSIEPEIFALLDPEPPTVPAVVNTVDGPILSRAGQLAFAGVGDAEQSDVWFSSEPSSQLESAREDGFEIEGIVGASFLMHYAVTFDRSREGLTLQAYDDDVAAILLDQLIQDTSVP
ncbi:MAG: hypothetical protein AAGA48_03365 [Myxococcota bacterium]